MYKVGLTGNYYSGQFEVSKIFEDYEVKVFDANLLTKFLLNYSPTHIQKIKKYFGSDIYSMGLLNLSKFTDNIRFNELLDLIEFDLLKYYEKFRLKHKDELYTIFLYDFIFERKLESSIDFKISCHRPKSIRKNDMKYLTSLTDWHIKKILDNEMDELLKNSKSDYVIQNYNLNDDHESDIVIGLESQIKKVHKKIMSKKRIDTLNKYYPLQSNFY
jgi:dephospho-CoA kinase